MRQLARIALMSMAVSSQAAAGPVPAVDSPALAWLAAVRAERAPLLTGDMAKAVRSNPDRSYPASCLSYPLPTTARGPTSTASVRLGDVDGNQNFNELVNVIVSRVACSGGKSAVLIRFDRTATGTNELPDVPAPYVVRSGQSDIPLRVSIEPNTYYSDVIANSIAGDATVVLETIPGLPFDLNQAFTLGLDTIYGNAAHRATLSIAAYNAATHPDGALNLEINGYLTGSYYAAAKGGEGIFFEVGERPDANATRFAFFSWFTYGPDRRPYWIVGNADVAVGARTVTIPARYFNMGGFAGDFDPRNIVNNAWGSVTFTFPNCDTMNLQFTSTHSDDTVPRGDSTRQWTRLSAINGFVCGL